LLKAFFLNSTRLNASPSNGHGSRVEKEKSSALEYYYLYNCRASDLRDELRCWSCIPTLTAYQSVSNGGSDNRSGTKTLKTIGGDAVSLAELLSREVGTDEWTAKKTREKAIADELCRERARMKTLEKDFKESETVRKRLALSWEA